MNKQKGIMKFSLLAVSVLTASAPAINANIPALAKAFPDVPLALVEMLTTIPSFFLMISLLVSNLIAQRIGVKPTITIGIALVMICGLVPVVSNNFAIIMASRALFGFGVGLFNSLLVAIVTYFFQGTERSQLIGYQSAFEGFGGIAITFIAGQLLKFGWHWSFLAYAIAIPALILFLLFVPDLPRAEENRDETSKVTDESSNNFHFSSRLLGLLLLTFIVATLYMTMGIKVPTLLVNNGYGTATDASYVILGLSVGAMSSGFLFGRIYNRLHRFILPASLLLLSSAMLVISLADTTVMTIIGGFITGFGFRLFLPFMLNVVNENNSGSSWSTSLILIFYNLGAALSPYSALWLQDIFSLNNLNDLFMFSFIVLAILFIAMLTLTIIQRYHNVRISNRSYK